MSVFDWIAAVMVISSMGYLTFVLTVPEWLAAYKNGKAVSLLPERKGTHWPIGAQVAIMLIGLALCFPLFYYLWIPVVNLPAFLTQVIAVVGLFIYLSGFAFMLWARRTLGNNWGVSTSLQTKLRDEHELVQSGPYAIVRHPMYFGGWVFMLGLLLLYSKWVIVVLFVSMLFSFSMRARREEAALAERFNQTWIDYSKRTKFLIPFIY